MRQCLTVQAGTPPLLSVTMNGVAAIERCTAGDAGGRETILVNRGVLHSPHPQRSAANARLSHSRTREHP